MVAHIVRDDGVASSNLVTSTKVINAVLLFGVDYSIKIYGGIVVKKIISIFAVVALCLAVFCGCGAKEVKLSEVMSKINSDFSLSLESLSSADDLNKYYSIETADVKQFAAEIDKNNNAPVEIVLVEAVDADAAARVESALTTRYNAIYSQYTSYTPEKVSMVKECKVTKDGNFVSLIVAENAPKILDTYYSFIK